MQDLSPADRLRERVVGLGVAASLVPAMFTWMTERNFYVLSRERPSKDQPVALADQLLDVWLAAAGLDQ